MRMHLVNPIVRHGINTGSKSADTKIQLLLLWAVKFVFNLPHSPIGSCSDLLQVPVPLRNLPHGFVDLLPVEACPGPHSHSLATGQGWGQDMRGSAPSSHENKPRLFYFQTPKTRSPSRTQEFGWAQIPPDKLERLAGSPVTPPTHTRTHTHC